MSGTGMGMRMGVDVGVAVGEGGTGGTMGAAPCGAVWLLAFCFLPVAFFLVFRRGGGVLLGCAIELPSLLKKSPIGLLAAQRPPARKVGISAIKTTLFSRRSII